MLRLPRLLGALLLLSAGLVAAQPTHVTVRVISRDAKFIGSSMQGASVILRDRLTGEILAEGVTRGDTGDTGTLMKGGRPRGARLAAEETAGFSAVLELDAPRLVEVRVRGPLSDPHAANEVSATQWVIPGRHLDGGDGWVLEMPGFVVRLLAPLDGVRLSGAPRVVDVAAEVTMMCGCPTAPGGLWDAAGYEIRALLRRDGTSAGGVALTFAGSDSHYRGEVALPAPGEYELLVYAYDPRTGNTGLARGSVILED